MNLQSTNKILIHRSALVHNHTKLQQIHPEAKICHVLKSNAYGHGLATVAPIFDSLESPFLVVNSLQEALALKNLNVKTSILILGFIHPDNLKQKLPDFHFTVFDLNSAQLLHEYQPHSSIHLFVDTGMSREGIRLNDFEEFVGKIKKLDKLKIVGLASHLADADNPTTVEFTEHQVQNFKHALQILNNLEIEPEWKHISASGGSFKIIDQTFNMLRVGLASYGIHPLDKEDPQYQQMELQPALRFTSTLAQVKEIEAGAKVGYNGTFTAEKKMKIGFIPAGYFEGVDRRLSNKGVVQINGKYCEILGRVSMNITIIDLSSVESAKVGDEVIIYSSDHADQNSIYNAAKLADTIPYEMMVHLPESIERKIV